MNTSTRIRSIGIGLSLLAVHTLARAQQDTETPTQSLSVWMSRNWPLVAAGLALVFLIALFISRSSKRKTTTVINDYNEENKKATVTEVRE